YEYTNFLFGFTKSLILLKKNPEVIVAAMEELVKYWKDFVSTFYREVEGNVDILCVNGDLAEQKGPVMNPKVYNKYIKPIDNDFSNFIHSLRETDLFINYHTCGATTAFLPHFIDIRYEAYNPVQLGAYDMEPCSLKKRFGQDICFWGGLCKTNILAFGTPSDVADNVKHNINCFKPNGGYIAANIHNITAEVPPENIVAMFDTAFQNGRYR
ncbi:MAG: hypothetical protein GF364_17145, partial [Candidatus Lokiarchaeota archaeon]|nr:hypothetical protein [Candidatus Lokiarchaeota archaeon]